ncbi:Kynurenine formamidase [Cytospora paraplurivora]|uniref:Kynurenine formamidase n=1 Tax=Cytospora paraplurivora TaxID=2898453 RepID=A0AAN9ULK8_9PEZI
MRRFLTTSSRRPSSIRTPHLIMTDRLKRTEYYYDKDNVLQNVVVWEFPEDEKTASQPTIASSGAAKKYWLIFIHGGAWRDPRSTFDEAQPTINALLDNAGPSTTARSRIAGFASINYRLSPHPSFTQDPGTTPAFASRAARHPDHLADVMAALRFLRGRLGLGEDDYVLFGHSAGAFLSYQVLQHAADDGDGGDAVPLPAAVVGFEGIYDLVGLEGRTGGAYAGFIEAAFGTDRQLWSEASPATAPGSFAGWSSSPSGGGRLAVLAHSPDDELVDLPEVDALEGRLRRDGVPNVLVFRDLKGGHFEVLNDGSFGRVLVRTLEELERLNTV